MSRLPEPLWRNTPVLEAARATTTPTPVQRATSLSTAWIAYRAASYRRGAGFVKRCGGTYNPAKMPQTLPPVTIVGLGPGDPGLLTVEARAVLRQVSEVYVRTRRHPTVARLPARLTVRSFDDVYTAAERLDRVYVEIADRVLALGQRPGGVVYAVPGHPLIAESSVQHLLHSARQAGVATRVVPGLSFLEPVLARLGIDPFVEGLQVLDAAALLADYFGDSDGRRNPFAPRSRGFDATRPLLLGQIDAERVASGVKLILLESVPPDHVIAVVRRAGVAREEEVESIPLHELDRVTIDHLTCVYIPGVPLLADVSSFETLRHIIARLRAPGGCPWDREQTHQSLVKDLIEETYEVVDAIERLDHDALAEELGDVLLNVLLQTQIGEESGNFALEDALRSVNAKLVRRHPHVFGDVTVAGAGEVLRNWDQIKRAEQGEAPDASRLGGMPLGLPALAFAQKIQGRAERAGFAWRELPPIEEKIAEELVELRAATGDDRVGEFGDLLFVLVSYAGMMGINAEEALRSTNRTFVARFRAMERLADERRIDFATADLAGKLELWRQAKVAIAANSAGDAR